MLTTLTGTYNSTWKLIEKGGQRGGDILIGPGSFIFNENNKNLGKNRNWRCQNRKCRATCKEIDEEFTLIGQHNNEGIINCL